VTLLKPFHGSKYQCISLRTITGLVQNYAVVVQVQVDIRFMPRKADGTKYEFFYLLLVVYIHDFVFEKEFR
jgi:hypothetical protein